MATLKQLHGRLCEPHQAVIKVDGMYAKCSSGCTTEMLRKYAASLNGHIPVLEAEPMTGSDEGQEAAIGRTGGSIPPTGATKNGSLEQCTTSESKESTKAKWPPVTDGGLSSSGTDISGAHTTPNGSSTSGFEPKANAPTAGDTVEAFTRTAGGPQTNGAKSNGHYRGGQEEQRIDELLRWRNKVEILARHLFIADLEYQKGHLTWELVAGPVSTDMWLALNQMPEYAAPSWLSQSEAQEEAEAAAKKAWEEFRAKERNDLVIANGYAAPAVKQPKEPIVIPWESLEQALAANEAYLARTPVVDKLCYSSAVSMITGGKHAGKSTLARWMAICVSRGWEFLKRPVNQGTVLYIASEDETMPARQELIRLGWQQSDALKFLSASNAPMEDQLEFLQALTEDIKRFGVVLVVLDMLFDFVRIGDEMGYSETRRAVGEIQEVASKSGAHVTVLHHAPKHASLAADAAVTALGSQGLAARVSPIVLVRKHGPGLHSVVSTSVRDPRGEAITEQRLVRNEDGSVTLGGQWKDWMQAEVFAPQVMDLLGSEEGSEMTAADVAAQLEISYRLAAATLSTLYKRHDIDREGTGKKGRPFRYSIISGAIAAEPTWKASTTNAPPEDLRLPYKD